MDSEHSIFFLRCRILSAGILLCTAVLPAGPEPAPSPPAGPPPGAPVPAVSVPAQYHPDSLVRPLNEEDFAEGFSGVNRRFTKHGLNQTGLVLYQLFLRDHPGHRGARMGYAQLLSWSGRVGQAIGIYESLVAESADDIEAKTGLAICLSWDNRIDRSESLCREILAADPGNIEARVHLARLLGWKGQYRESLETARQAARMDSTNLYALQIIANVLRWKGETFEALHYYQKISRMEGDSSIIRQAHTALAEIVMQLGRTDQGLAMLGGLGGEGLSSDGALNRIEEIRHLLRPRLGAKVYRAMELAYEDTAYRSGFGNTGLSVRFSKRLNIVSALDVSYHVRTESSDRFAATTTPLYDMGIHEFMLLSTFQFGDRGAVHLHYEPTFYWSRREMQRIVNAREEEIPWQVFYGGGLYGYLTILGSRWYAGFGRTAQKLVDAASIRFTGDHGFSLSPVWGNRFLVSPTIEMRFFETGNGKQRAKLFAAYTFTRRGYEISCDVEARRYLDIADEYFSYDLWVLGEIGFRWFDARILSWNRGGLKIPCQVYASMNRLDEAGGTRRFGALRGRIEPGVYLGSRHSLRAIIDGYINTDRYVVYSFGAKHAFMF